jgi:hypothetical protein
MMPAPIDEIEPLSDGFIADTIAEYTRQPTHADDGGILVAWWPRHMILAMVAEIRVRRDQVATTIALAEESRAMNERSSEMFAASVTRYEKAEAALDEAIAMHRDDGERITRLVAASREMVAEADARVVAADARIAELAARARARRPRARRRRRAASSPSTTDLAATTDLAVSYDAGMPHSPSVKRDFPKPLLKALDKRGIRIITTTWLPGPNGKYANGERGYVLDDNGTQRIRNYLQVMSLAGW